VALCYPTLHEISATVLAYTTELEARPDVARCARCRPLTAGRKRRRRSNGPVDEARPLFAPSKGFAPLRQINVGLGVTSSSASARGPSCITPHAGRIEKRRRLPTTRQSLRTIPTIHSLEREKRRHGTTWFVFVSAKRRMNGVTRHPWRARIGSSAGVGRPYGPELEPDRCAPSRFRGAQESRSGDYFFGRFFSAARFLAAIANAA
jgi:hypothetical protein